MGGGNRGAVIVTGASGRIGAAAARRLAGRYHVVAFDRAGPPRPPPGFETLDVDLTSDASVRGALTEFRSRHGPGLASLLHFAAYYEFSGRPSPEYEAINVKGTERLMRGLREAGVRADQFVYASTMVVHAPGAPGRPLNEDAPLGPTWEYARSKLRGEEALRAARGDTPLVVLRLANVYDDLGGHPVLAQQVRRVLEGRLTARFFPGDPSRGHSYVHRDDVLDAVERVVDRRRELPPELTLLIGEPGAVGYGEIQRALGRAIHGSERPTRRVPKALARAGAWALRLWPGGDPFVKPWMVDRADDHYELDVSRAREVLGWVPRHSFREAVASIGAAARDDPARWYRENGLGRG
jgi:nucleoside-diphosphate-sugar epimerase